MSGPAENNQAVRAIASLRDLKARILSGLLLAAVGVVITYAGVVPFAVLVVAVTTLMSWEWGRVVRSGNLDAAFAVHAGAVAAAVLLSALGYAALGFILVIIGALLVLLHQFGRQGRLSGLGVLYVGVPAVSLLWLRSDEPYGFAAVVFILLVVCTTDTFAYFGGRSIGGARLWPRISPNKTWAGLASGVVAATLVGALFGSFLDGASQLGLALTAFALALVSQAGDLAESALKRGFGVKDASALIPGHGGFLDRLDGLVFAATFVALFALFANVHAPASALLFWF
jgi:phosphatidate cytidylyltransferase